MTLLFLIFSIVIFLGFSIIWKPSDLINILIKILCVALTIGGIGLTLDELEVTVDPVVAQCIDKLVSLKAYQWISTIFFLIMGFTWAKSSELNFLIKIILILGGILGVLSLIII